MKRKLLISLITFIVLIVVFGGVILAVSFWPNGKLVYTLSEDGSFYSVKAKGYFGKEIVIEESYNGLPVTSIEEKAFVNQTSLKNVVVPNTITSIDKGAFDGCSKLTSIILPNNVTLIEGYVFRKCSSLKNISIPNCVTSIGSEAFSGCSSLVSIELPDSLVEIDAGAFYGCSSITDIAIPNSVISIGSNAFKDCSGLKTIVIPNSVTSIGSNAFKDCSEVTSIKIPDSVTSIGGAAFSGTAFYNNLNNWEDNVLYIGNHLIEAKSDITGCYTIKSGTLTIAEYAFTGCKDITSIILPYGLNSIGSCAFADCLKERSGGTENYGLVSVTIPISVTSIGWAIFEESYGLKDVFFEGTLERWNAIEKKKGWGEWCGNYTIHCSDGDIAVRG